MSICGHRDLLLGEGGPQGLHLDFSPTLGPLWVGRRLCSCSRTPQSLLAGEGRGGLGRLGESVGGPGARLGTHANRSSGSEPHRPPRLVSRRERAACCRQPASSCLPSPGYGARQREVRAPRIPWGSGWLVNQLGHEAGKVWVGHDSGHGCPGLEALQEGQAKVSRASGVNALARTGRGRGGTGCLSPTPASGRRITRSFHRHEAGLLWGCLGWLCPLPSITASWVLESWCEEHKEEATGAAWGWMETGSLKGSWRQTGWGLGMPSHVPPHQPR